MSREIAWLSERDSDDPGRLRSDEDERDTAVASCDRCGIPLLGGAKSLAGVGIACSDKCLNLLCVQHEHALSQR